jgi:hypothetical protein
MMKNLFKRKDLEKQIEIVARQVAQNTRELELLKIHLTIKKDEQLSRPRVGQRK